MARLRRWERASGAEGGSSHTKPSATPQLWSLNSPACSARQRALPESLGAFQLANAPPTAEPAEPPDQKIVPSSQIHVPSESLSEPPTQNEEPTMLELAESTALKSAFDRMETSWVPSAVQWAFA